MKMILCAAATTANATTATNEALLVLCTSHSDLTQDSLYVLELGLDRGSAGDEQEIHLSYLHDTDIQQ